MSTDSAKEAGGARLWLGEDGILRCICQPGIAIELSAAKEQTDTAKSLSGDKHRPILVDIRDIRFIDKESRTHYSSQEIADGFVATGLVVGSPVSRMIGTFFLGLNKALLPTKIFSNEAEAIEWLKQYVD